MTHVRLSRLVAALLLSSMLGLSSVQAAEDASRYYEDALQRFDRKDDAGAIIQLRNALKADPGFLAAHMLMGRAALRKRDYATAEVALREAQKRGVSRAEYIVPLAELLLTIGRQKEMLETMQPTDLPARARFELLLLRARAHLELTQYPLAISVVKEARALDPTASAARVLQARIMLESGHLADAATLAEEAVRVAPEDTDAWSIRAESAYAGGLVTKALEYYSKAVQLSAKNSEALLGRSSVLMDLGRMDEAKTSLLALAKVDPKEPRSAYLRAVIAEREGDREGARKLLGEVVAVIDSLPRSVLIGRSHLPLIGGLAHLGLGGNTKAKEYLELHIRFFPAQMVARKPLATIQLAQGDAAGAVTTLEPLLRTQAGAHDRDALSLMAAAYSKLKRHQRATELLEEAARLGDSPEVRTQLGLSMMGALQTEAGLEQLRSVVKSDPGQARASAALALNALREQQPKRAVELMEAVIEREPGNLAARNLLGVARAAAGDFAGARQAYDSALAADRNFDSVKLNLAKLDRAEGKADQARARLDALLKENPDHVAAGYELAMLNSAQGRTDEAIRRLENLRDKNRQHVDTQVALIDLYVANRDLDKALALAKDRSPSQPGYLAVQAALVRVQLRRGDSKAAQATLTSMTRIADFDPAAQYRIARLQVLAGNAAGAIYSIEKALQGDPSFVPARLMQGEILLADGALDKAEARAQELLKLPKPIPEVHLFAGDVASARRQWPAAIQYYRNALAGGAGVEVADRLYQAHVSAGNAAQGRAAIEALVKARPQDVGMKLMLSQAQTDAGLLREAKATLDEVLKQGETAPVLNNLANLQWRLKDPAAQQTAERALKLSSEDPMVLDTLGWILVQKGQPDGGLRYLREARLRAPENAEVRYHLAVALSATGRKPEARTEVEAALATGVDFPEIAQARALAAQLGKAQ